MALCNYVAAMWLCGYVAKRWARGKPNKLGGGRYEPNRLGGKEIAGKLKDQNQSVAKHLHEQN